MLPEAPAVRAGASPHRRRARVAAHGRFRSEGGHYRDAGGNPAIVEGDPDGA